MNIINGYGPNGKHNVYHNPFDNVASRGLHPDRKANIGYHVLCIESRDKPCNLLGIAGELCVGGDGIGDGVSK